MIATVRQEMMDHPSDLKAQSRGCADLTRIASHDREEPGPWGGRRVATKYLDAGIGEAYAQGALNCFANADASPDQIQRAAHPCLDGISGLTVQNDYDKGLHLLNNAPHLWEAVVGALKRRMSSRAALHDFSPCILAGLFGSPQPTEAAVALGKAGGYDVVFDILKRFNTDDTIFQAALCALSDNVNSGREAAEYIANTGGPLRGIEVLVNLMPLTLHRHFQEENGFGLQYEIVHDTNGLLWHDDANRTWRKEFYRLGYLKHLMALMADNPSDAHLQDNCCQAVYFMTEDNATVQEELAGAGAVNLLTRAMMYFAPEKLQGYCTVVHSCATALLTFAHAKPEWLTLIRNLGLKEALTDDVVELQKEENSHTPTWETFPGSNIVELRNLLA